jgi:hypothetical protein
MVLCWLDGDSIDVFSQAPGISFDFQGILVLQRYSAFESIDEGLCTATFKKCRPSTPLPRVLVLLRGQAHHGSEIEYEVVVVELFHMKPRFDLEESQYGVPN